MIGEKLHLKKSSIGNYFQSLIAESGYEINYDSQGYKYGFKRLLYDGIISAYNYLMLFVNQAVGHAVPDRE